MIPEKTNSMGVNIAISIFVFLVLYLGYNSITGNNSQDDGVLGEPQSTTQEMVSASSQEVTQTFNELKNLNRSIVNSVALLNLPAFVQLKDNSVQVSPEPTGRENPFAQTDWKTRFDAGSR